MGDSNKAFDDTGWHSLGVTLLILLIVFCAYYIKTRHLHWLPESVAAMAIGLVGGVILTEISKTEAAKLKFDPRLFFFGLLPPIILEAGYTMKRRRFFKNMSTILMFAVLGTLISAAVIGSVLYYASEQDHFSVRLHLRECLSFAALISAVDPVATLSILGSPEINADPMLYSIVFGESVLNDAVSIVLFDTVNDFGEHFSTEEVWEALGYFCLKSLGSITMGVVIGLLTSYICKNTEFHRYPEYEVLLVLFFAYTSYAAAEVAQCSGIMALFFCGIILAHYNWYNLSKAGKTATYTGFKTLAVVAETGIFAYLGLTVALSFYSEFGYKWNWKIIGVVIGLCLLGRLLHIGLLANLANCRRKRRISFPMQILMWFAGLRGAIAFALALNLEGENSNTLLTACLAVVLVTTVVCGAFTGVLCQALGLKGAEAGMTSGGRISYGTGSSFLLGSGGGAVGIGEEDEDVQQQLIQSATGCHRKWNILDHAYLKPLFGGKMHARDYQLGRSDGQSSVPRQQSRVSPPASPVRAPDTSLIGDYKLDGRYEGPIGRSGYGSARF